MTPCAWFDMTLAAAGDDGLRRAGLSAHEVLALAGMTTPERMRFIGPDRLPDVYAASVGAEELSPDLRRWVRAGAERMIAEIEAIESDAAPEKS
ncbi:hypothetical protein DLJ49_21340 [Rhodovulum sp. 12E13]|uniref:hypothetical protein n=1 Tax=Rhodovulum sp. 12E13 TaxID=2203891 RepID=UPI000E1B181E|nr:hypothetical protein [Rhodovulum sp. 12E13]RDC67104.1 hypothetical protein DLJ49_21340 [Rhodovulum sp. 12E13]